MPKLFFSYYLEHMFIVSVYLFHKSKILFIVQSLFYVLIGKKICYSLKDTILSYHL